MNNQETPESEERSYHGAVCLPSVTDDTALRKGLAKAARAMDKEKKHTTLHADPQPRTRGDPIVRSEPKIGRNDPCPCESGKKYKRCCGRPQLKVNTTAMAVQEYKAKETGK